MTVLYLFDIDGTLLDAAGAGRRAFDETLAEQLALPDASAGIRYGGKTDPAILDEILVARRGAPATAAEHAAFVAAYLPRLDAACASGGVRVLPAVVDTLRWLRGRDDAHLGIATGNIRGGAEVKLRHGELDGWFAFGGYGCDSPQRPALVAAAIARGTAQPPAVREVVVVGDTVHDIAAARACGATVCAVTTGGEPATALAHADAVFASLAELPAWHRARFD